ncbi:MAG: hypothetical protein Q8915_04160, partial [Bacillota bacterium]|nr:hypothetical protein [Bacillota bacterium]
LLLLSYKADAATTNLRNSQAGHHLPFFENGGHTERCLSKRHAVSSSALPWSTTVPLSITER